MTLYKRSNLALQESDNQELCPFEMNKHYRREQITSAIGSDQEIVGIFWGNKYPGKVVCTAGGAKAKQFGFEDRELEDGSWLYYGQGTKGDQVWKLANEKVRDNEVLLFKTHSASSNEKAQGISKNWYEFKGCYYCTTWEYYVPDSGEREGDRMIRFHLAKNSKY